MSDKPPRRGRRRPRPRSRAARARMDFFVKEGNDAALESAADVDAEPMDDETTRMTAQALRDMRVLIAGLYRVFGLVIHPSTRDEGFAYHWHSPDGACHKHDAREGFATMPAAILGAMIEQSDLSMLHGAGPLIAGLQMAGVDLSDMAINMPPDLSNEQKARNYGQAMRTTMSIIEEAARDQPSGFAGALVGAFLGIVSDLVKFYAADAHTAADQAERVPLPGVLPAGCVAVPSHAILMLEQLMQEFDSTAPGGKKHGSPSRNTTLAA